MNSESTATDNTVLGKSTAEKPAEEKPIAEKPAAEKPSVDQIVSRGPAIPGAMPIAEQKSEEPRKRIPLASIPVTIFIGLLIAAVYLGGRIFTAHRVQKPDPAIHSVTPAVLPPSSPAQAQAVAQPAQSEAKPEVKPEVKPEAKPEVKAVTPPALAPAPKPASATPLTSDSADNALPMIEPHSGQRYIQVGALDPDAKDTRRFVERLRNEGMDPHVAQGPTPVLMRVLIGPFTNSDALNEKKAQIESEGIDTFIRDY